MKYLLIWENFRMRKKMELGEEIEEVYNKIPVELDTEKIINNPPFTKWTQNTEAKKRVREIISESKEKVLSYTEPRSTQTVKPTSETNIKKYSPPRALLDSEFLAVGVLTIGDKVYNNPLRKKIESGQERMNLKMLVIDALENIALDKAFREVALKIKSIATEQSLNTTRVVSPGSGRVDWGIENQSFIFDLVNAQKIGVQLKESNAIQPQKTLSFVIGLGENIENIENIFSCKGCKRSECPYRAE